jgi:hypothetical protein
VKKVEWLPGPRLADFFTCRASRQGSERCV